MDNENITVNGGAPQVATAQPVASGSVQPVVAQPAVSEPKKTKKKTGLIWGLIGGGVALVVAIVLLIVFVFLPKSSGDPGVDELLQGSLIKVEVDGKYGYINTDGKMVIQPIYDDADDFEGGFAEVELGDEDMLIDRDGNVKMRSANMFTDYIAKTGNWLIGISDTGSEFGLRTGLYDRNLNLLSGSDMDVFSIYNTDDYFGFLKPDSKKGGMIDANGKIMFELDVDTDKRYDFSINYGDTEFKELKPYCVVETESKIVFVGCTDGKIVTELNAEQIDYVGSSGNNIFYIKYNSSDKEYPGYYKYYYIQDDAVAIETVPSKYSGDISDYAMYRGLVEVEEGNESKYYNVCTKEYVKYSYSSVGCDLTRIDDDTSAEFESYSGYTIEGGVVLKGNNVAIPSGEYDKFKELDKITYLYLKALGKEYILAAKGKNTFVVDLKSGKAVHDFGEADVYIQYGSSFIKFREDEKTGVYSLVSGKDMMIGDEEYVQTFAMDYIIVDGDKDNYYNTDFKMFYSE